MVEGFSVGGVDYIVKPFNRDELLIRVKNHLELADSRKKILQMNQTRDKMYSIIAHDIRSPLSSISMMITTINDGLIEAGSEYFAEIMKDIEISTKNTLSLLQNLLSWTKIQSETISLTPQQDSVYQVINECYQLHKGNAKDKGIIVELDIQEDTAAFFDQVTIHTVIRNLISNAIKFTPQNGNIKISTKTIDNDIEISIKDSGVGMPAQVIEKIFVNREQHTSLNFVSNVRFSK